MTQALFSMTLVSRSVELLLDRDPTRPRTQLAQLRDLQREALAEMRALIFELRPGNLEQDGLTRALRTHTAALQGRIGLPIVVESTLDGAAAARRSRRSCTGSPRKRSTTSSSTPAPSGPARGRRGSRGGVRLRDRRTTARASTPSTVPDGHLGLAGMRARADKIGARVRGHERGRATGTTIEVVVPDAAIAAAADADAGAGGRSVHPRRMT